MSEETKKGTAKKVLKGCGKESRILSVAATMVAAKVSELYGIQVGPQEISVLGLSLFTLAQRVENYLSEEDK